MKAKEMRLRRAAECQGFKLVKSRRRDPRAIGFGRFCLVSRWGDERVVGVLPGVGFGLIAAPAARGGVERFAAFVSLDVIEKWLTEGMSKPAQPQRPKQQYGNWHGSAQVPSIGRPSNCAT